MDTQSDSPVSLPSFRVAALLPSTTSSPSIRPLSSQGDPPSRPTSHIRKVSRKKRTKLSVQGESYRRATTIRMLPDNVLLEIFDIHRKSPRLSFRSGWDFEWYSLAHICRSWRQIVFASPHRLNLRLVCKPGKPVRKYLGIWPAFPIVVECPYSNNAIHNDDDNIIAALEHPDRICDLQLYVTSSKLRKAATVMQKPFPVLTRLRISGDGTAQDFPGRFMGGSAPSLQRIDLNGVPIPTLPTLLLSASDLVTLRLWGIPATGYMSPEAMVVGLAALPMLEDFVMEFHSATSRPDQIRPPPATRTVLPALIHFKFRGASEYLEALVSQIDAPQLDRIEIQYFNQLADFRAARLSQFIDRSAGPETTLIRHATVIFGRDKVTFTMHLLANNPYPYRHQVIINCEGIDWQVSHMAQVLSQFSVTLSSVIHLQLEQQLDSEEAGADDVEWLHLLHQFPTVHTLHINRKLAGQVALALEDIAGGMAAEVLPSLELIWIGGRRVKKFETTRRLSGRPVVVCTKKEFDERLESYVGK